MSTSARGVRVVVVVVVVVLVLGASLAGAQPPAQPGWEVRAPDRVELVAGQGGALSLAIAVDRGLSVSKDGPIILDLAPPKPVTVRRRRMARGDAVDPDAEAPRFTIPIRSDAVGDHAVPLRLRFWLCRGRTCRPVTFKKTVTVVVASASVAPDAGID